MKRNLERLNLQDISHLLGGEHPQAYNEQSYLEMMGALMLKHGITPDMLTNLSNFNSEVPRKIGKPSAFRAQFRHNGGLGKVAIEYFLRRIFNSLVKYMGNTSDPGKKREIESDLKLILRFANEQYSINLGADRTKIHSADKINGVHPDPARDINPSNELQHETGYYYMKYLTDAIDALLGRLHDKGNLASNLEKVFVPDSRYLIRDVDPTNQQYNTRLFDPPDSDNLIPHGMKGRPLRYRNRAAHDINNSIIPNVEAPDSVNVEPIDDIINNGLAAVPRVPTPSPPPENESQPSSTSNNRSNTNNTSSTRNNTANPNRRRSGTVSRREFQQMLETARRFNQSNKKNK